MSRNLPWALFLFAGLSVAFMPLAGAERITLPKYIKDEHRATLQGWLNNNPRYRAARDSDCCDLKESLDYNTAEHRENADNASFYFAYGGLSQDGSEDFAVVLVEKTRKVQPMPWNADTKTVQRWMKEGFTAALAVFNGPFAKVMDPIFLAERSGTPDGSILWLRRGNLCVGPAGSGCGLLVAEGRGYVLRYRD